MHYNGCRRHAADARRVNAKSAALKTTMTVQWHPVIRISSGVANPEDMGYGILLKISEAASVEHLVRERYHPVPNLQYLVLPVTDFWQYSSSWILFHCAIRRTNADTYKTCVTLARKQVAYIETVSKKGKSFEMNDLACRLVINGPSSGRNFRSDSHPTIEGKGVNFRQHRRRRTRE